MAHMRSALISAAAPGLQSLSHDLDSVKYDMGELKDSLLPAWEFGKNWGGVLFWGPCNQSYKSLLLEFPLLSVWEFGSPFPRIINTPNLLAVNMAPIQKLSHTFGVYYWGWGRVFIIRGCDFKFGSRIRRATRWRIPHIPATFLAHCKHLLIMRSPTIPLYTTPVQVPLDWP